MNRSTNPNPNPNPESENKKSDQTLYRPYAVVSSSSFPVVRDMLTEAMNLILGLDLSNEFWDSYKESTFKKSGNKLYHEFSSGPTAYIKWDSENGKWHIGMACLLNPHKYQAIRPLLEKIGFEEQK